MMLSIIYACIIIGLGMFVMCKEMSGKGSVEVREALERDTARLESALQLHSPLAARNSSAAFSPPREPSPPPILSVATNDASPRDSHDMALPQLDFSMHHDSASPPLTSHSPDPSPSAPLAADAASGLHTRHAVSLQ